MPGASRVQVPYFVIANAGSLREHRVSVAIIDANELRPITHKSRQFPSLLCFRLLLSTSGHLHQKECAEKRSISIDIML
jgi:hypothetical protein